MKFSFVHAADIHLDSPMLNLARYEDAPVDAFRGATRQALSNLVQLAIEEEARFVLIAGDLYDGDCKDFNTPRWLRAKFEELRAAGIRVLLVQGNHDAQSRMKKAFCLQLPDNVHLFPTNKPETVLIAELEVAVHGQGFAAASILDDISADYPTPRQGFLNIGLLHTNCGSVEGHDNYAPSTVEGLTAKGYDYWALGHIHKRQLIRETDPWIVYPGNIQGRHINEEGRKGCTLVTAEDGRIIDVDHRDLDVVRWMRCKVDATGCEDPGAVTGSRPIEFIQATDPIVIIDEPQSVDTTAKSKEAISSLSPLCTLRFSATHVDKYNMMYKLDSVDAYERKLVKQIEVAGIEVKDSHNKAYIKLLKVDNRKSPITAQIEMDVVQKSGEVKRKKKTVRAGADLLEVSGGRNVYEGYIVNDIYCEKGNEYIDFTSKPDIIRLGQAVGEADDDEYKRLQIRKTIEEHLDKELNLRPQGLKVLSLFFIDRVANYRQYEDGNPQPGKYARMFEEEYAQIVRKPKYKLLFEGADLDTAAEGVHDGYFAVDKKKTKSGESVEEFKDSRGEGTTQADESAYQLIMRDKERLLSFDSKLKFIFSHSALREGWDNPNVFQICTLNETGSVMKKRQEIGRGLRIAVNQDGERVHGFEVNRLTVMANESYEEFARQLQKEIEQETGIRFGVVEAHLFANIPVPTEDHRSEYLGVDKSQQIWDHLKEKGYIDAKGKVQDSLRSDLKTGQVDLPDEVADQANQIQAVLRKIAGKLNIKNADERKQVKLNKAVFLGEEFKQLWDRIKYRTTFRVMFDTEALVEKCVKEIAKGLVVGKARFVFRKSRAEITRGGVMMGDAKESLHVYDARDYQLPDVVTFLQNETNLTRRSLVEIMKRSDRLDDFKNNPQKYIEQVSAIIQHQMRLFIVDGIKYQRIGDEHFYAQELFEANELFGYLSKNMLESEKSVFDHVVYDSDVEEEFARSFELSDDIKVYAKLPDWFKIDTPLGTYNPDWAVLVEVDGQQKLYFVVESKGSLFTDALRPAEQAKIDCGTEHFKALGTEVKFTVANNYESFSQGLSA